MQNGWPQGHAFDTSLAKQDQKAARAAPTLARQTTPSVNMAAAPVVDDKMIVIKEPYADSTTHTIKGGFSASVQGRPDRFSAAGLQGWTAFQQLDFTIT